LYKEESMERLKKSKFYLIIMVFVAGIGLFSLVAETQEKRILEAVKVSEPPKLDGAVDILWEKSKPLTIKVIDGANLPGGETDVTLRAVYTKDMIYFLAQYKDPTQSFRRSPWQKQADGTWKKLRDPNDKGGDNNLYYEDKFAWAWIISAPDFEKQGCAIACHTGEGKPYGNKYTEKPGERLDMWHLKSVRTGSVGQVDDQYVDSTRYDKEKSPNAGRKNDPKTGGGYEDNQTEDKKMPKFALRGNKPVPPYWIVDSEKEPFDDSKYKAGDEVPGILVAPFTGDRGDVAVGMRWDRGMWTIEFARKLVTGSEFDVQFNDMKKSYAFGIAVFDNAQVRHAFDPDVYYLIFK
jgi:hypothetical protein